MLTLSRELKQCNSLPGLTTNESALLLIVGEGEDCLPPVDPRANTSKRKTWRARSIAKQLQNITPPFSPFVNGVYQVNVRTSLGPSDAPLSVIVSLVVPRLVFGETHSADPASIDDADEAVAAAAVASLAKRKRALIGSGGDGIPLRFPITQVGQTQEMFIEVCNPADVPVSLQLAAAESESIVWTPPTGNSEPGFTDRETSAHTSASSHEHSDVTLAMSPTAGGGGGSMRSGREGGLAAFHVRVNALAPVVLEPGGSTIIGPVRFAPARAGLFSAHVYLRNNLTHLEPVCLEGEADTGLLSVRPWAESGAREGRKVSVGQGVEAGAGAGAGTGTGGVPRALFGFKKAQVRTKHGQKWKSGDVFNVVMEEEVSHFAVDFRSWARSPPTTEPVIKKWVLSNDGKMPLTVSLVGIRKIQGWNAAAAAGGSGSAGGGLLGGAYARGVFGATAGWFWRLLFGDVSGLGTASAAWGEGSVTFAGSIALCAEGGFTVMGSRCEDGGGRWQAQTLQPGEEVQVAVAYAATHCDPVGRVLDIASSAGNVSIMMLAAASGGPSAAAACKSARRAAGSATAKARGAKGWRTVDGRDKSFGGGGDRDRNWERESRWGRAWLLVKIVLLVGAVYVGIAALGAGNELPRVPAWAKRLQACVGGAFSSRGECGRFGVSVEVSAAASVVVSSTAAETPSSASSSCSSPRSPRALKFDGDCGDENRGHISSNHNIGGVTQKGSKAGAKGSSQQGKGKKRGGDNSGGGGGRGGRRVTSTHTTEVSPGTMAKHGATVAAGVSIANDSRAATAGLVEKPSSKADAAATNGAKESDGHMARQSILPSGLTDMLTSPQHASKPVSTHQRHVSPKDRTRSNGTKQQPNPPTTGRGSVSQSQTRAASSNGNKCVVSSPSQLTSSRPNQRPTTATSTAEAAKGGEVGAAARNSTGLRPEGTAFVGYSQRNNGKVQRGPPPVHAPGGGIAYSGRANANGMHGSSRGVPSQGNQQHGHRAGQQGYHGHGQPLRGGAAAAAAAAGSVAGGSTAPRDRGISRSSSSSSSLVDSPSPPALASPAASMIEALDGGGGGGGGRQNNMQQYHKVSGGRRSLDQHQQQHYHNGHGSGYASASGHGQGMRGDFRLGGEQTATASSASHVGRTGSMFSRWGQPEPATPSGALSFSSFLPAAADVGAGGASRVQHPLERPTSGWLAENSHSIARGVSELSAIPASGGGGSGTPSPIISQASPPFGPIGSNRVRLSSGTGGSPRLAQHPPSPALAPLGVPIGPSRRPPPGLSVPPGLRAASGGLPFSNNAAVGLVTTQESEWSENLDTFVTASAVAAGVLGADEDTGTTTGSGSTGDWGYKPAPKLVSDDPQHPLTQQHHRHDRALSAPAAPCPTSPAFPSSDNAPVFDSSPFLAHGDGMFDENSRRSGSGAITVVGGSRLGGNGVDRLSTGSGVSNNRITGAYNGCPTEQQHRQKYLQSGRAPSAIVGGAVPPGMFTAAGTRGKGGGSRLGYYLSSGAGDPSGSWCGNGEGMGALGGGRGHTEGAEFLGVGEDAMPAEPPVFLAGSSFSSLDSSGGGGGGVVGNGQNGGDFFGFMGDDDK